MQELLKKGTKVLLKKYEDLSSETKDDLEEAKATREYIENMAGKEVTIFNGFYDKESKTCWYEFEEDKDLSQIQRKFVTIMCGKPVTKEHSLHPEFFEKIISTPNEKIESLAQTVGMMISEDYKERFKAEYYQLKIRKDKLQNMFDNWDNLSFTPTCPKELYKVQLGLMDGYLRLLEERAKLEKVDL